ncbi:hypothetical protein Hanom_Chr13g01238371 [Helianthus anomalus]
MWWRGSGAAAGGGGSGGWCRLAAEAMRERPREKEVTERRRCQPPYAAAAGGDGDGGACSPAKDRRSGCLFRVLFRQIQMFGLVFGPTRFGSESNSQCWSTKVKGQIWCSGSDSGG